jgi:CDGSH-type Zn-finger protein
MSSEKKECRIKLKEDGPIVVSGNVPLEEKMLHFDDHDMMYLDGKKYETGETYVLCGCGKSKNPPFCDGFHEKTGFKRNETAPRNTYMERAEKIEGPDLDLYDDKPLCALARFCYLEEGSAWELVKESDNLEKRKLAIRASVDCPAGRLVIKDKEGRVIEPEYEPEIWVLQDPQRGVSGPLFVKGGIPVEGSDGYEYEVRNRITLCRCGESKNQPFCDRRHMLMKWTDYKKKLSDYFKLW